MHGVRLNVKLGLPSGVVLGWGDGFDYDHIAVITDIPSVQKTRGKAMQLGMVYALGHAMMVLVLGSAVIFFQLSLPKSVDEIAERLVGITLIVLRVYVFYSFFRAPEGGVPLTRFAMISRSFHWRPLKIGLLLESDIDLPAPPSDNYAV